MQRLVNLRKQVSASLGMAMVSNTVSVNFRTGQSTLVSARMGRPLASMELRRNPTRPRVERAHHLEEARGIWRVGRRIGRLDHRASSD
jgi:hypothetical protein